MSPGESYRRAKSCMPLLLHNLGVDNSIILNAVLGLDHVQHTVEFADVPLLRGKTSAAGGSC